MANSSQTSPRSSSGNMVERLFLGVVSSPWLWGTAVTFAFYAILPFVPFDQVSINRYFTSHWIEHTTTWLFFVGMATLVSKSLHIPAERSALFGGLLDGVKLPEDANPVTRASQVEAHLNLVARRSESTQIVRRIRDVCGYIAGRQSTEGIEDHLNYRAELAAGRLHDGYALIRTITWAIPILGFLGTVIGITMAIANITPEQLESSLPEVTAGLAVAFDTTALSLALSMILVFATFVIERAEQSLLDSVEDFGMRDLLSLFPLHSVAPQSSLLLAEARAADLLLKKSESLINRQTDLWQGALEALRERWTSTLERQQQSLDTSLQSGVSAALVDHVRQLAMARTEFVASFESSVDRIARQLTETQAEMIQQQQAQAQLFDQSWRSYREDLVAARDVQSEQLSRLTQSWSGEVASWNEGLQDATLAIKEQLTELRSQGETLLRLTDQGSELIRLEDRLAENLDSVRVADSLEATLLNLNAAVNLLSSRTMNKAA